MTTLTETPTREKYNDTTDFCYKKDLVKLDIKQETNKKLSPSLLYFCYKLKSCLFEIIDTFVGIRQFLTNHKHLYELINSEGLIRFYMDIDVDKENPIPYSYNDLIELCNNFITHIRLEYAYDDKITYNIHLSITDGDLANNEYLQTDKVFTSAHIIFNIMTENVNQVKQVMLNFKNRKYPLTDRIDLNVYSYRKKFRTINQAKEQIFIDTPANNKKLQKFILLPNDERLFHDPNIYKTDFVSVILTSGQTNQKLPSGKLISNNDIDLFIDVEIEDTTVKLTVEKYNIQYAINQNDKLQLFIDKLTNYELTNNYIWNNALNLILTVIIMSGGQWNYDILDNTILKQFLKISQIGKYADNDYIYLNIELIKNKIDKKELHQHYQGGFIEPLKPHEVEFIYNKLNLPSTTLIIINKISANANDEYLTLSYNETANNDKINSQVSVYIQKTRILLVKPEINTVSITNNNKTTKQTKIYSNVQYQYEMDAIMNKPNNTNDKSKCEYTIKYIDDLKNVVIDPSINTYVCAPVGSGKSYNCLRKDTIEILNANPKNKILKITDGVIIAEKEYNDTLTNINENKHKLFRKTPFKVAIYNKLKILTDYDDIDILICCIDSVEKHSRFKPTHIQIDEFNNVNKRLSSTKKIGNDKDRLRDHYFNLCKNCVLKLYDADVDDNILSILKQHLNIEMTIYQLTGFQQQNNTIILNNYADTIKNIKTDISNGKNITISSSHSTTFLKQLCDELYRNFKITGVLITSQGATEFGTTDNPSKLLKKKLSKDTTLWNNYNVVVYSPAITCGVSFDIRDYFYKHYHISQTLTADATQNAQMLYRIRGNITNTIEICFISNIIKTLKNVSIENMLKRRITNFSTFTNNVKNGLNTNLLSIKQDRIGKRKYYFKIDKDISILANIQNVEEFNLNIHKNKLVYVLFQTLYNYGSKNLICNFYSKTFTDNDEPITELPNEPIIELINEIFNDILDFIFDITRKRTEPVELNTLMYNKTVIAFENSIVLDPIPEAKHNEEIEDENEYNRTKSYFYKKYNIPSYTWFYYNNIMKCDKLIPTLTNDNFNQIQNILKPYKGFNFPECETILKICNKYAIDNITPEIQNYTHHLDKSTGLYDKELFPSFSASKYNHLNNFYKINNIAYFQVKHIIYNIFDNFLSNHSDKGLLDFQKEETTKKDMLYFIEFIYGLYICFKIFDMLDINFNDLSVLYLNDYEYKEDDRGAIYGIMFNKKKYNEQINNLIKKTDVYFGLICAEREIEKYKKDLQNRQPLQYAFNLLCLNIELGEVRDLNAVIKLNTTSAYKYRTQQVRFPTQYFDGIDITQLRNELKVQKINISNIADLTNITNNNILDDALFYIPQERTIHPLLQIKQVSYPKILLYNPEHYRDSNNFIAKNKNANSDYLYYGIKLFCDNVEVLTNELDKVDTELKTTIYYNPIQPSNKIVNIADILEKMKDEKTKKISVVQEQKQAEKEAEVLKKQIEKEAKQKQKEVDDLKKQIEKEAKKIDNAIKRNEKANERVKCELCDVYFTVKNKTQHMKTHK